MSNLIPLYHQAEDYFFSGISSHCLELNDGVNAYLTGVPVADLNFVYITKKVNDLDGVLKRADRFFDEYNFPFVIIIPDEGCTIEMEGCFRSNGYHQADKSAAMGLKLDVYTARGLASFNGVTIRSNDKALSEWVTPLIGAFESTEEICAFYIAAHKRASEKHVNLRHFSLYKNNQPVSSITLSLHNNIARIDDLSTLPEFQGKGYATHLMDHILLEAKRLGASHCFLESSDAGLGIYQKLGFATLFESCIYSRG